MRHVRSATGCTVLHGSSPERSVSRCRSMARPADRTGEHDGLHAPALEPVPHGCARRTDGGLGECAVPRTRGIGRDVSPHTTVLRHGNCAAARAHVRQRRDERHAQPVTGHWTVSCWLHHGPCRARRTTVIGGTLKIGCDVILYRQFRHVGPPEEQVMRGTRVS
jgi:hypothetical protein